MALGEGQELCHVPGPIKFNYRRRFERAQDTCRLHVPISWRADRKALQDHLTNYGLHGLRPCAERSPRRMVNTGPAYCTPLAHGDRQCRFICGKSLFLFLVDVGADTSIFRRTWSPVSTTSLTSPANAAPVSSYQSRSSTFLFIFHSTYAASDPLFYSRLSVTRHIMLSFVQPPSTAIGWLPAATLLGLSPVWTGSSILLQADGGKTVALANGFAPV